MVKIGKVYIGGGSPVIVQSMTDTVTSDISNTVKQILSLVSSGSEIVRLTVNDEEAARAVPFIKEKLLKMGCDVPLVGDFHYNGHILLDKFPECAQSLDKYRINPGNVGFGSNKDIRFASIVKKAIQYSKVIRIGVNWGSLDKEVLIKLKKENEVDKKGLTAKELLIDALVNSAVESARYAEKIGCPSNKIVLSCKVSSVKDSIHIYKKLSSLCKYPLHLGLTEAGTGLKGIISASISVGTLLQMGIGDTIRVSLTPAPGESKSQEVKICQEILQSIDMRNFSPILTSCPGCGRTDTNFFRSLVSDIQKYLLDSMTVWRLKYVGVENMKVAVMGCIVNGPGEAKHADLGISLSGIIKSFTAVVFIKGKKSHILRGQNIFNDFVKIIDQYVEENFSLIVLA